MIISVSFTNYKQNWKNVNHHTGEVTMKEPWE